MITVEQAKEYLDSVGVTLPDFILVAFVDTANSINECLEANYPPATQLLIQTYLLGLMGLAAGDQYISSQTAPSGASRSFRYQSLGDRWRSLYNSLRLYDTKGCTDALVPADPTKEPVFGGLVTVRGGRMCGD
ncbi:hypothetical protein FBF48_10270 [Streptococcus salivarius]|uniref:Gp11 n=1 Tax=Streptococcus salivarius TaxID=1304 RepID=A0AAX2V038_STRSL|nr:hypothetical protein [Streptococcus salivarius]TNF65773.1 hypothetical protein FBF48_10270 [Streptococcus salivarius]